MPDLKDELAALRIEREPQGSGAGRWIGWTVALLALAAAGAAICANVGTSLNLQRTKWNRT